MLEPSEVEDYGEVSTDGSQQDTATGKAVGWEVRACFLTGHVLHDVSGQPLLCFRVIGYLPY